MSVKNFRHLLKKKKEEAGQERKPSSCSGLSRVGMGSAGAGQDAKDRKMDHAEKDTGHLLELSNFFACPSAFNPMENLIESLYCARVRCRWSCIEGFGLPGAEWSCIRVEEWKTDVGEEGPLWESSTMLTYKKIPAGALVKNCPRRSGALPLDDLYSDKGIEAGPES